MEFNSGFKGLMKTSSDSIRNRTCNLPACSVVRHRASMWKPVQRNISRYYRQLGTNVTVFELSNVPLGTTLSARTLLYSTADLFAHLA